MIYITGGEPLLQEKDLEPLVEDFKVRGFKVYVDTNGSYPPPPWRYMVDKWIVDFKTLWLHQYLHALKSGEPRIEWIYAMWLDALREEDEIKCVVGNEVDLEIVERFLNKEDNIVPSVLISPIIRYPLDEGDMVRIADLRWARYVAEWCIDMNVRFSIQTHKLIGIR